MPALRSKVEGTRNVIIESNSVLKFLRPDLYLTVLDPATADFKNSAREFLDRANAVIIHRSTHDAAWESVSLKPVADRPVFHINPPPYVTNGIIEFVRASVVAHHAQKLATDN